MSDTNDPLAPAKSLTQVVGQGEWVKDLVDECAEELATVNTVLKTELAERDSLPGVEQALEKSEALGGKVQEASAELSAMNRALKDEVRERHALEHELGVVTEQGEAARHASLYDALTGLPNRALFNDRLEHGLAQAKRRVGTLAVMFVDLEDFTQINARHGHAAGDDVLRKVAERLRKNMRCNDTISRHGGDELLYLLLEVRSEADIAAIAVKVGDVIQAPYEVSVRGVATRFDVKASIGISVFPKDGTTAEQLISRADEAMDRAKRCQHGHAFSQPALA